MSIHFTAGGAVSAGGNIIIQEGGTTSSESKAQSAEVEALQKVEVMLTKLHEQGQASIAEQIKTHLPEKGSPATEHLCNLITAAGVLVADISPLATAVLQFFKPTPTGGGK